MLKNYEYKSLFFGRKIGSNRLKMGLFRENNVQNAQKSMLTNYQMA